MKFQRITQKKKIDDFKSELNNMFRDYEFNESINFKNAFNIYFNGEIIDILSEKKDMRISIN